MAVLEVSELTKSFGGVVAVNDVSFTVEPGTIFSVIGPNGAGKTTLFNVITGVYAPGTGAVLFDGGDVTGLKTFELARLGISRSFQNLQVFFNMTALENVMVGRHLYTHRNFLSALLHTPALLRSDRQVHERSLELLDKVGLADYADEPADGLPYGVLKRLEIARALANEPKVLLLDEPAAGCNATETQEIDGLIKQIAELGITVVLVEHDMRLVMGISDRILVLNYGKKLAEGTVAEVRSDPEVIQAYLGAGTEQA